MCAVTWVALKGIMLSEKKSQSVWFHLYNIPQMSELQSWRKESVVIRALGWDAVGAQDGALKSMYSGFLCGEVVLMDA